MKIRTAKFISGFPFKKWDVLRTSNGGTEIVVRKKQHNGGVTFTLLPITESKYKIINRVKFMWIRLKYSIIDAFAR